MKQIVFAVFFLFVLLAGTSSFGQGVRVGPDGEFSEQTLSLPYAFYNDSFGFAVGYVYGVVGRPQKQATLLATVMAGSKGSAMGFLVGRDLQGNRGPHRYGGVRRGLQGADDGVPALSILISKIMLYPNETSHRLRPARPKS